MEYFVWQPAYVLGIPVVDAQHERLFRLAREAAPLEFLLEQIQEHFRTEEELMAAHHYAGLAAHKLEHDSLLSQLAGAQPSEATLVFLDGWVTGHIASADRAMAGALLA